MSSYQDHIIAHYKFEDADNIGKDYSGQGKDGIAAGLSVPSVAKVSGRNAATFAGETMEHRIFSYLQIYFKM